MSDTPISFRAVADHALLVTFAKEPSDATSAKVLALTAKLDAEPFEGLRDVVPALVNLLVEFDPLVTTHADVEKIIRKLLTDPHSMSFQGQLRHVEVCFDDEFAPDLGDVSGQTGLNAEDVIEQFLDTELTVRMYGFAPGYAYMTGVPEALHVPRKAAPVRDVPAGSVLVAGRQCLVSTLKMPTGWSIIGRSPTPILTRDETRPFLFDVGDRVRFVRIDRAAYEAKRAEGENA